MQKWIVCLICSVVFLTGCAVKSKEEQEARNEYLRGLYRQIGIFDNPYNLHPSIQEQCHNKIKELYISKYSGPNTWSVSKKLAPMDFTNTVLYDYAPQISERMGFDTSNTLAFMTRYKGTMALGIGTATDFVCLVQIKGGYMHFRAAFPEQQFEARWSVQSLAPVAWFRD